MTASTSGGQNAWCVHSSRVQVLLNGLRGRRDVGPSERKSTSGKNPSDLPVWSKGNDPKGGDFVESGGAPRGWLTQDVSVPLRVLQPYCASRRWCPKARCPLGARSPRGIRCTELAGLLSRDSPSPASASRLRLALQPAVFWHLEFPVRPTVGARPEPASCECPVGPSEPWGPAASAPSHPQLRVRSLQRPVQPLRAVSVHPRQLGGPPRPGREPGPSSGGGWGGRRDGELETDTASEQLLQETDGGGGGGRQDTPPSGDWRRDTSFGGRSTVSPYTPARGAAGWTWRDRQARAAGSASPARSRGGPGIPCKPGRSSRRRQTGCESLGK